MGFIFLKKNAHLPYICNKIGKLLIKSNTDNKTLAYTFDTILGSIDKAYKILINSEERKIYDEQLEKCKNNDYIEIVSPQNKYYADPQLVKDGNKTYIFFEIISRNVDNYDQNLVEATVF